VPIVSCIIWMTNVIITSREFESLRDNRRGKIDPRLEFQLIFELANVERKNYSLNRRIRRLPGSWDRKQSDTSGYTSRTEFRLRWTHNEHRMPSLHVGRLWKEVWSVLLVDLKLFKGQNGVCKSLTWANFEVGIHEKTISNAGISKASGCPRQG